MITRCAAGGCLHLHLERTVITMTPEEMVRLARLVTGAVEHYGLTDERPPRLIASPDVAH